MDCSFGCVNLVIMGLHKLQFTLFFGEKLLDMLCGLIVHDVELDLENGIVVKPHNWYGDNSVVFIMIHDKEAHASI